MLWLLLLLSLLLHLALLRLLPQPSFPEPAAEKRMVVEIRPQERDLDVPIRPELDKPRDTPAKRLAEANQVVEKEQAPRGDSLEDMRPDASAPAVAQPQARMIEPQPTESAPTVEKPAAPPRPVTLTGDQSPAAQPEDQHQERPSEKRLDLQSLLQIPEQSKARIAEEWRQKYRKDVAEGDAVWLDSEQDLLFSFFQRLRTNIYNVWNYPSDAARSGQAGACLLKITIRRDGTLERVELKESTGFPRLDRSARAAVRKGAPYGKLPSTYPKEKISILAFFHYDLRGAGRRPGRIY